MSKTRNRKAPELLWKGALFGLANIIPGVSGGTLAVITGVYDDFMEAVSHLFKHWKFLFFYLLGAGVGIIGGSFSLEKLFELWPQPTLFCFMGFIIGGIPLLWKRSGLSFRKGAGWLVGFLLAFCVVVLMRFVFNPAETEPVTELTFSAGIVIFVSAAAAASAMVIPGISGSFILLLLGMYTTFVGAVTDMNIAVILVILAGVATGLLLTARIISFFLKRFHRGTYAVILGLVIGSVFALWPGIPSGILILSSVIALAGGIAGGYFLGDR